MKLIILYIWISLRERPMIGAVCSISTSLLSNCYKLLTDESALKLLSAVGIVVGILISLLTLLIKVLDVRDRLRHKSQNP